MKIDFKMLNTRCVHMPVLNEVTLPGRGEEYETEAGLSTEVKSGGPLPRETYRTH